MLKLPFEKLLIWQKGIVLAKAIYRATKLLPKEELYGLSSQMRRAAVSIPSNIAEGSQRGTNKDFLNFIHITRGSLAELQTQIVLAMELELFDPELSKKLIADVHELQKMLHAFSLKLATNH